MFDVADHYIMDTAVITLPFMFRSETPLIITMCHLMQLQSVPDTLLVLQFKYDINPTIHYKFTGG